MVVIHQMENSNLGAIPVVLLSLVKTVAKYEWNEAQIKRALGEQYTAMQQLNEAGITELALLLEEATGTPSWKWFTILRDAKEIGYFRNGEEPGNGSYSPPPPPPKDNTITWAVVGVAAVALIYTLRR